MGRKCPTCRGEFSDELSEALKERRLLIRDVKRQDQVRQDPAMQRILGALQAAGLANPLFSSLPGAEELARDPRAEPMPLDPGDLVTALSGRTLEAPGYTAKVLRAELQRAGLSPSGTLPTLAERI
eukprot:6603160-Prymnesium_polylepis.1